MSKVTNSNFISFLKQCGPWEDNESQFEEHVRNNAKNLSVVPFEYRSIYEKDAQLVQDIINSAKSHVLLICGRAGDGKTHFLGKIFENAELLGVDASDIWQEILKSKTSVLHLKDIKGFDRITVVSDLSQIIDHTEDDYIVLGSLLEILEQKASSATSKENHLLLIAGNNGKILEKLSYLEEDLHEAISKAKDADDAVMMEMQSIKGTKQQFALWEKLAGDLLMSFKNACVEGKLFENNAVNIINMSNRMDDRILQEIFDVIIDNPQWAKCKDCSFYSTCPIQRNVALLHQPWLQQRVQHILFMLKADGAQLTIRNVQSLVSNAILGQGFESAFNKSCMTCKRVASNIKDDKCTLESNVYDNLLGLNFKPQQRDSQRPIFELMSRLKLGLSASKHLDDLLLVDQPNSHALRQNFFRRFDVFGVEPKLQASWQNLKKANLDIFENNRKVSLTAEQNEFTQNLQALRRLVFFNVGAPLFAEHDSSFNVDYDHTEDLFTNPYLMTSYPHTMEYLQLYNLVKPQDQESVQDVSNPKKMFDPKDKNDVRANPVARKIILALNRLFTGLLTLHDDSEVFIAANNSTNVNLLFDEQIFKFKAYNYGSSRSINLGFIPEFSFVPVLQFIDEAELDHGANVSSVDRKTTELLLTPKIFECLMLVAEGMTRMSLASIDVRDILVFKDRIYGIIEPHASALFNGGKINQLLSSISRIEIEAGGSIILRQRINFGSGLV